MSSGMSTVDGASWGWSNGWTCSRCQAYVRHGVTHNCPVVALVSTPVPSPDFTPQIAAALDRIADALDRLASPRFVLQPAPPLGENT